LNAQAQRFVDQGHFDADTIQAKTQAINDHYAKYCNNVAILVCSYDTPCT